jgi:hypothetical protein
MADTYYYCGSIYKRVKRGRNVQEVIARASGIDGHLMTSWNGKPCLVTDNKLYVWTGKEPGFQRINWEAMNG